MFMRYALEWLVVAALLVCAFRTPEYLGDALVVGLLGMIWNRLTVVTPFFKD